MGVQAYIAMFKHAIVCGLHCLFCTLAESLDIFRDWPTCLHFDAVGPSIVVNNYIIYHL